MKNILALIASPRKRGNCEIAARALVERIPRSDLRLLRLSDFKIKPCKACYLCLFKKQRCILKDDLETVIQAMTKADAYLIITPTYFLGPNASLKNLLDRGLSFYGRADQLWGKPAVGLGIAGIHGKEGYTRLGIESFLKLILADIKAVDMLYGALPGEILRNPENMKKLDVMADALFNQKIDNHAPACPVCGGVTFRFLDEKRVRCMLCSNEGSISIEKSKPIFRIKPDDHGLFKSKEDALTHRQWLIEQVRRFSGERTALKEIAGPYHKGGDWIKP